MLEIECRRTIRIGFEFVARADCELVQGVRNEPLSLVDLIHRDRPEALNWRRLTVGESQRILVRAR